MQSVGLGLKRRPCRLGIFCNPIGCLALDTKLRPLAIGSGESRVCAGFRLLGLVMDSLGVCREGIGISFGLGQRVGGRFVSFGNDAGRTLLCGFERRAGFIELCGGFGLLGLRIIERGFGGLAEI
jgi:hypothetical protein